MPSYKDALELFHEWTVSDSLRRHGYAVEAAMGFYADHFGEDQEKWRTAGLLHDIDYEKHQSLEEHPYVGVAMLREKGYPEYCPAMRCKVCNFWKQLFDGAEISDKSNSSY